MEQESSQVQNQVQGLTEGNTSIGSQPPEPMIPQSRVNEIVRERLAQQKDKLSSEYNSQVPNAAVGPNMDQIGELVAQATEKRINVILEAKEREMKEAEGQRLATEFISKLEAGKGAYEDFDQVVGSLPFDRIPHIIQLANGVENTADVMYELRKNPGKIAALTQLVQIDPTGTLAMEQMHDLSSSIKKNRAAQGSKSPNEPLSQIKSSPIGADNGSMTVSDFRKIFR